MFFSGLDFAHCKNGYVYHTKLDHIQNIESINGVVQHTGDNILSLVNEILISKEFINTDKYEGGKLIYFDIFGIYFINYSSAFRTALHIGTSFFSLLGIYLTLTDLEGM